MKSDILYPGAFPMARVQLAAGESLKAESGAMVSISPTIDVESKVEGGIFKALSRRVLTGEHFFFQTLRATRGAGEALLAPTVPGDILVLELDGVQVGLEETFPSGDLVPPAHPNCRCATVVTEPLP